MTKLVFQAVDTFLQIRPRLRNVVEEEVGWITATLDYDPKDLELVGLLDQLQREGVVAEFRRGAMLVPLSKLAETGPVNLKVDLGNLPGYFESHQSLIGKHPNEAPEEYLVWNEDAALENGYRAAVDLLTLLRTKAEVWDSTQDRFFLVDQQAIEIALVYGANQTLNLPEAVPGLLKFLDGTHIDADTRWVLFRKACGRALREVLPEHRLGVLFEQLKNVFARTQEDYSLYLERYSLEDVLKNFDEKRLKFVGDLNQILASIQTSLVAVPIGFFLVAEKFEPTSQLIGKNLVLTAGGLVFVLLVFVLSRNQRKTLEGVKSAIDGFESEQRNKVTEKSARLTNLLTDVRSQFNRVQNLLNTVQVLLVVFALIVVMALLLCSIPFLQELVPYSSPPPSNDGPTIAPIKF